MPGVEGRQPASRRIRHAGRSPVIHNLRARGLAPTERDGPWPELPRRRMSLMQLPRRAAAVIEADWAADATLGWWGPDGARRLAAATADPATLPAKATWYLVTSLPPPANQTVSLGCQRSQAPGQTP